jgi:uncharacterized oligopeptide transporter (OPT) family protein
MPVAVGLYLPLSLAVPILIGGLLHARLAPKGTTGLTDHGLLFGSGLIAGEALIGILVAALIAAQAPLPLDVVSHWAPSLLLFGAITWLLIRAARTGR